jgi:hypothetical protein
MKGFDTNKKNLETILKACNPKDSIIDKDGKMLDKCFNGTYYE